MQKPAILAAFAVLAVLGAAGLARSQQPAATRRADWVKFNPVTPLTAATFANLCMLRTSALSSLPVSQTPIYRAFSTFQDKKRLITST